MNDQARNRKKEAAQWVARGIAALKAKNIKSARAALLKARELDPQNTDALLWLTRTTRDPHRRKAILERVLQIDPQHPLARRALARVTEQLQGASTGEQIAERVESPAPEPAAPQGEEVAPRADETSPAAEEPDRGLAEEAPPQEVTSPSPPLAPPTTQEMAPVTAEEAVSGEGSPAEVGRCPVCGAVLRHHERTGQLYCVFCGYGTGEPQTGPLVPARRARPEVGWPDVSRARRCLTCDTISIPPAGRAEDTTPCPLCQQIIFERTATSLALPDACLPFRVSEAQAAITIEDADRAGLGRLLLGRREISRPRRVFLPVWLFNGEGRVEYSAPGREGKGRAYTESYRQVPLHCVPQIDGRLLRLASRADLSQVVPYRPEDGRDAFILLPNVPLQTVLREAHQLMLQDIRQKAQARAGRGAPAQVTITAAEVQDMVYQLTLLPVWVNEVRDGGRLRMGMVNGYTGEAAIGDLVRGVRR